MKITGSALAVSIMIEQHGCVMQTRNTCSACADSEFHISKPDGWPEGNYQVAILVNDLPAGTKTFTVR